ncbi:hypothetical protein [uncultured Deinococcus sp.]|nr:hypothetical protein [uncultured Deinococcus sp.]
MRHLILTALLLASASWSTAARVKPPRTGFDPPVICTCLPPLPPF